MPHPLRYCVYQEAAAILHNNRDSRGNVARALDFLKNRGYPADLGLFELNFFMVRPGAESSSFLQDWWHLYSTGGLRDQIWPPYILWNRKLEHFPLLAPGMTVGSHPSFRYHPHGRTLGSRPMGRLRLLATPWRNATPDLRLTNFFDAL